MPVSLLARTAPHITMMAANTTVIAPVTIDPTATLFDIVILTIASYVYVVAATLRINLYVNTPFNTSSLQLPLSSFFIFCDVNTRFMCQYSFSNFKQLLSEYVFFLYLVKDIRSSTHVKTTDLNYWIKLLSCITEANGGHIGLSHINLHWYY